MNLMIGWNDSPSTSVFHISGVCHRTNGRGGDNPGFSRADERCGEWSFHRTRPTDPERPPSYQEALVSNYMGAPIGAGDNSHRDQPTFVRANAPPSYRTSQVESLRPHSGPDTSITAHCQNTSQVLSTESVHRTNNQSNDINQEIGNQCNNTSQTVSNQCNINQRSNNQCNITNQTVESERIVNNQRNENEETNTHFRIETQSTDIMQRTGNQNNDTIHRNRSQGADTSLRIDQRADNNLRIDQRADNNLRIDQRADNNQGIGTQISDTLQHVQNLRLDTSLRTGSQRMYTQQRIGNEVNKIDNVIKNQSIRNNQRNSESSTRNEPMVSTVETGALRHHRSTGSDIAPMSRRYAERYPQCFFEDDPPPPYSSGSANRSSTTQNQHNVLRRNPSYRRSMHIVPSVLQANLGQNESEPHWNEHFRRSMNDQSTNTTDSASYNPSHRPSDIPPYQHFNITHSHNDTGYDSRRNQDINHSSSNPPSSVSNHHISSISKLCQSSSALSRVSNVSTSVGTSMQNYTAASIHHVPSSSTNTNALQIFPSDSTVPITDLCAPSQSFVSTAAIGGNRYMNTNAPIVNHGQSNPEMYIPNGLQTIPSVPPFFLNSHPHNLSRLHHLETQPLCTSTPINQSPATDRRFISASYPSPLSIAHNQIKESGINREQLIFQRLKTALEEGHINNANQELPSVSHFMSENHQPLSSYTTHSRQGSAPIVRLDCEFL